MGAGPLIDLSRPPIRPGPRVPGWLFYALVLAVSFALIVLILSLLAQPLATQNGALTPGARAVLLGLAIAAIAALVIFSYAGLRLRKGSSLFSNVLQAKGYPVGDPDRGRRRSDFGERAAWKRLKRGEITRVEYERLMAGRRFAHGEISAEEYHEILRQLTWASADPRKKTGDRTT